MRGVTGADAAGIENAGVSTTDGAGGGCGAGVAAVVFSCTVAAAVSADAF